MQPIELISQSHVRGLSPGTTPSEEPESGSFDRVLSESIEKVNRLQLEADREIEMLSKGEQKDIHGTMIAMEKAALSFELLMQVRNKVVAAYDEIRRMQI
jgi:flagellar hook-basal body complex protein FliE